MEPGWMQEKNKTAGTNVINNQKFCVEMLKCARGEEICLNCDFVLGHYLFRFQQNGWNCAIRN